MSDKEIDGSYWAVITADVLFDKDLSPSEKLLYAVITSLQRFSGYCYASNAYFENVFDKDERTIRRWLRSLEEKGHIHIQYIYKKDSKELDKRLIYATANVVGTKMSIGGDKNFPTPGDKNVREISNSYPTSYSTSYSKNILNKKKDNDTSNEVSIERDKNSQLEQLFDIFWSKYPKKVSKEYAKKAFLSKVKLEDAQSLMDGLEDWIASRQWQDRQYIPNPATFINQKKWLDELEPMDMDEGDVSEFLNGNTEKDEIYGDFTEKAE